METRQWLNRSLPQMLLNATMLLYMRAAFGLLFGTLGIVFVVGHVAAGYGISNERKWGYQLGLAMAFAPAFFRVVFGGVGALFARDPIGLIFEILLVVLLMHDDTRQHVKIWFR